LSNFTPPLRLYFIVPGLIALAGSGYLLWEGQQFRASALSAEGTVIELIRSTDRDGDTVLLPNVRYTNEAGKERTFVLRDNRSIFGYATGQEVPVLYNEAGTDERLDSLTSRWGIPGIIGLMGLIFTTVGVKMGSRAKTDTKPE